MIPRFSPRIGLAEYSRASRPVPREAIGRFESGLASLFKQRHGVAFPYGRTGLMLLLEAMGLEGRDIICPAYTCVVVAHAIVHSGNEPVFVDCSAGDFNMSLDAAESAITSRTGALIATSVFGYPVDLDRLDALRTRHPEVRIIQDCAHSFRAEWAGRSVPAAGDAAIVGLNVSKIVTSVFGGMVTTDDASLADKLRELRDRKLSRATLGKALRRRLYMLATIPALSELGTGIVDRLARMGLLDHFLRYYDETTIDMPTDHLQEMTAFEAGVGLRQLDRYEAIIANRRARAVQYDGLLSDVEGLELPPLVEGATYSHYAPRCEDRDAVIAEARRRGVQLGDLIEYSMPDMPCYRERSGSRMECPVSRVFSGSCLNLSVCTDERGADRVAKVVRSAIGTVRAR